jgi:hypothetical protein
MVRVAYAEAILSSEILHGSTGQSGPMLTLPVSVPVSLSGTGDIPFDVRRMTAPAIIAIMSSMTRVERLLSGGDMTGILRYFQKMVVIGTKN